MKKLLMFAATLLIIVTPVVALCADKAQTEVTLNYDESGNPYFVCYMEKRQVNQLTENQLSLPTNELVDLILEFPCLNSFFASSFSYAHTYDAIVAAYDYNGFAELEKRSDSAHVMLSKFSKLIETSDFESLHAYYLNALLSVPVYCAQLTSAEFLEYERLSAEFWDATTENASQPDNSDGVYSDVALTREIAFYINNVPYELSGYGSSTSGNQVPLYYTNIDHLPSQKQSIAEADAAYYGIQILGYATTKYNCHSYAWHQPYTTNTSWITYPFPYLLDAHCSETPTPSVGSIIVYYGSNGLPAHSAIVTSVQDTIMCKSKWGQAGLYIHSINTVPEDYCYDPDSGMIICYAYNYSRNHTCSVTIDDRYTHTRTCLICGWSSTEPHIENVITGRCIVCGLEGPFPALAFSSTNQSNNDATCFD